MCIYVHICITYICNTYIYVYLYCIYNGFPEHMKNSFVKLMRKIQGAKTKPKVLVVDYGQVSSGEI